MQPTSETMPMWEARQVAKTLVAALDGYAKESQGAGDEQGTDTLIKLTRALLTLLAAAEPQVCPVVTEEIAEGFRHFSTHILEKWRRSRRNDKQYAMEELAAIEIVLAERAASDSVC